MQNKIRLGSLCHSVGTQRAYLELTFSQKNNTSVPKIVSEYDQEIPQHKPQTTPWHREEEPLNHHETPGRQIKQSDQLSLPHQDGCNTKMDTK